MAKFDELMAKIDDAELRGEVETAYLQSLESRDAKIETLETRNTELDGKVKEYAVANFDLIRKADVSNDDKPKNGTHNNDEQPKLMSLRDLAKGIRDSK